MPRVIRHDSRWRLAIFALALLQFCLLLDQRDITTAHEGRVAATAAEMLQRNEWLIPHVNNQPRLQKPPLAYWLTASAWSIAGTREVWLARLPAAMCGAIATLLVIDLARRTLGRNAALIAGLVWLSTWFVVDEYRKAMADPYLAFFTLLSVWSWVVAHPTRGQGAAPSRVLLLVSYLSLALGMLAKGPLILLHVPLALIPCHLVYRICPRHLFTHLLGIAIFLALSAAWPAYILRHLPNAAAIWRHELSASSATSGAKSGPLWHYFAALATTSAPWTIFAAVGALMVIFARRRRERRALWPLIWLIATVIVFTFVPMKKDVYLLPAMPAMTLLISAAAASAIRSPRFTTNRTRDRWLLIGHAIAAIVALGVMLYLVMNLEFLEIEPPAPLLAGAAVVLFMLLAFGKLFPRIISLRTVVITAIGFALCVHAAMGWIRPERDNRRSNAGFARGVIETAGDEPLVVIGGGLREDVLFYLGRPLPLVRSIDELPANFKGHAIVTFEHFPSVRRADRGDDVAVSAERAEKDTLHLFRFPKAPPSLQDQRERR
jgi:4-amino-4-deoxy-L-arabinose transferase-like glycosyltransferase